jgi:hypothetical protein
MWMQDGCKVYMDSYMASNGSCFMITWIVFKKYLFEVGLTQNQETMALRTLTTVDLFYSIMCEDPHESKFIEIVFGWGPSTYDFTLHLRVPDHTTWLWRCLGTAFGHFLLGSHDFMVMALGLCVWTITDCARSLLHYIVLSFGASQERWQRHHHVNGIVGTLGWLAWVAGLRGCTIPSGASILDLILKYF